MTKQPSILRTVVLSFQLVVPLMSLSAHADDMAMFATGGYAVGAKTKEMMTKVDTNGDGMISRAEWLAFHEHVFDLLDRKHRGYVTDEEFIHAQNPELDSFASGGFARGLRTEEMLKLIDTNHDGKVSRAEYLADQTKIFDMMDTSPKHKGSLDMYEVIASGGPGRQ